MSAIRLRHAARRRNLSGFLAAVIIVALVAVAGPNDARTAAAAHSPAAEKRARVLPVIFVPRNIGVQSKWKPAVESAMATVDAWYSRHLNGQGFDLARTRVVRGRRTHDYYCPKTVDDDQCIQVPGELGADPGDVYRVTNELASRGIRATDGTVLAIFWASGYGYAGGVYHTPSSGFFAVGDWALYGISNATPHPDYCPSPCSRNSSLGAIAHELGHALGLPHPTNDGRPPNDPNHYLKSVMSGDFRDFPQTTFIESPANPERTTLAKSRVLLPRRDPHCPRVATAPQKLAKNRTVTDILCSADDGHVTYFWGRKGQRVRLIGGGIPPLKVRLVLMTCCKGAGRVLAKTAPGKPVLSYRLRRSGTYAVRVLSISGAGPYAVVRN